MSRSLARRLQLAVCVVLFAASSRGQDVEVATQLSMTEGSTVDREGNVYFTEIMTQR
jgi:hypothetical protein